MHWLNQLFTRRHRYNELSASIREHLDEKIADLIDRGMRSVKLFSSRERMRRINDSVITGADTLRSIASNTVQRPSPESET